jgi:predicted CopG family antitoxin
MTVKINLTIDEEVIKRAKSYAKKTNTSVSKMVQEFLDKNTGNKKSNEKNFVEKYAGTLKGKLSDKDVEKIKAEKIKEKYGY